MDMGFYTGVGSRGTPYAILMLMAELAKCLRERGYVLRSGGAPGADFAFESGAGDAKEIYLPWRKFNSSKSPYSDPWRAMGLAEKYHPNWKACGGGARLLHARNVQEVLGLNLDAPSKFLVCWTPSRGGTQQAIRVAEGYGVPVLNLKDESDLRVNRDGSWQDGLLRAGPSTIADVLEAMGRGDLEPYMGYWRPGKDLPLELRT